MAFPSDCADIAVLDRLDGFNIQPRIGIPFSGPIDPATATSENIFLVGPAGHVVGINQRVWEPLTSTLYALAAQQQIATFFTSDGAITIDPDGAAPFFETPTSIVPEDLAFIP